MSTAAQTAQSLPQEKKGPKQSRFMLVFGGAWLFFGFIFGGVGLLILKKDTRFKSEGHVVTGTVLSKQIEEEWNTQAERREYSYVIRYTFQPESGAEITGSTGVTSSEYETFSPSQPVEIEYLKSDPSSSRLAGTSDAAAGWIFFGVGALLTLIGVVSIFIELKRRFGSARLLREGMIGEGSVVSCGPGSLTINNVTQWQVRYRFNDTMGRSHEGVTPHMSPDEARQWSTGAKGRVRFDKEKPHKNIWVG